MGEGVHVRVGGERYVLDVREVREVETRGALTAVPGAPAAVAGIRNLRGTILPVVELAPALGLGEARGAHLVVAEAGELVAGLLVDEVLGVEPLPAPLEPAAEPVLRGRALVDGEPVAVLDAAALLGELAVRS